jgi:N-glycosylase/DNA lyase
MKQQLAREILELKKSHVKKAVEKRIEEFKQLNKHTEKWFSELCFCILTANSTAERCIEVQKQVGNGFRNLPLKKLKQKMKSASCRFYNKRAEYIAEARKEFQAEKIKELTDKNPKKAREWLVQNIRGIGMKEASHFLRNVGYNISIIDFHILDVLKKYKIAQKNIKLNAKNYPIIENKLKELAKSTRLSLPELDLYLWYMETGRVLK